MTSMKIVKFSRHATPCPSTFIYLFIFLFIYLFILFILYLKLTVIKADTIMCTIKNSYATKEMLILKQGYNVQFQTNTLSKLQSIN